MTGGQVTDHGGQVMDCGGQVTDCGGQVTDLRSSYGSLEVKLWMTRGRVTDDRRSSYG